jgi:4-hydroxybenzoate polyprenyltransferase
MNTATIRAYAQLVRLPNVFTALADICLAALAVGALPAKWLPFSLLLLASACLYCAGMVWNDYFDLEQDLRERPFRPLPSGRVSPRAAASFGAALMAAGMFLALLAGQVNGGPSRWAPLLLAGLLVGAILLYDAWLKRTWAGPLGMGLCRFLNVLLGLTLGGNLGGVMGVYLALVVGLYVSGVTWFARTEARRSSRPALVGAALVMFSSLLLALPLPVPLEPGTSSPLFLYLLVALGFLVGLPAYRAISEPTPPRVQAAVKRALIGLVVLDATLAAALAGTVGLVILLLLLPVLYLGRWIYST